MRIGIDMGGTKIEGIALADSGEELLRIRVKTPRHDYEATIEAIAGIVRNLEAQTNQKGTVGIGIPGAISPRQDLLKTRIPLGLSAGSLTLIWKMQWRVKYGSQMTQTALLFQKQLMEQEREQKWSLPSL